MNLRLGLLALLFWAMPCSAVHAQEQKPILKKKPAVVLIGDRWKTGRKTHKAVDVSFYALRDMEDTSIIRFPNADEGKSNYRNTAFPLSTAKDTYFDIQVLVTISAQAKVTECTFDPDTPVDPEMPIDPKAKDHICPMLVKEVPFYPALDNMGAPAEFKGVLIATYSVWLMNSSANAYPPPMSTMPISANKRRRAQPVNDIDFETLGLTEKMLKSRGLTSIFATLKIGIDGKPKSCFLGGATYDDALDHQICTKAMALDFIPRADENQKVLEDDYNLMLFTDEAFIN